MCLSSPDVSDPTPPIDREAEAAQKNYRRTRERQSEAFDESDTDVVGQLIAKKQGPAVTTQLKSLMGARA